MEFHLIDYSGDCFRKGRSSGTNEVPPKRGGKFVQIRSERAEYIVLCPKELARYHANIVERFCREKSGIKGRYNPRRDNYVLESPGWEVAGGGIWEVDEERKMFYFSGISLAYGRFDPDGLRAKIKGLKPGYSVEIT